MYRASLFNVDSAELTPAAATPRGARDRKRPNAPNSPPLTENKREQAAVLLTDACQGRASFFFDSAQHLRWYRLYYALPSQLLLYIAIGLDLALALFEEPNGDLNLRWPVAARASAELICLLVFAARVFHLWLITPPVLFWQDRKNVALMCCILVRFTAPWERPGLHVRSSNPTTLTPFRRRVHQSRQRSLMGRSTSSCTPRESPGFAPRGCCVLCFSAAFQSFAKSVSSSATSARPLSAWLMWSFC